PESSFSDLSAGGHAIYFKASDDDGNEEGESGEWSWQFYKDTTPPSDPSNVESPSHTTGEWSNDNMVEVTWVDATDLPSECGVEGYSIAWDTSDSTLPDTTVDISVGVESATSPELSEGGSHYVHIRSKDIAGNWQNTVHFGPFCIDMTGPAVTIDCMDTVRSVEDLCYKKR
ncbi:MAG: hypothetical protein ACE5OR_12920, partial [bacterium]